MIYELHFHPLALKEWKKLSQELQEQFKKKLALPEFPWFAQLLGQGPTYVLYVGWALAQDHYKYHGNSGRAKKLKRRLENPHVISAKLSGQLKDCYKIKLHQAGYRLVYQVNDNKMILLVVAVGKRNKNKVYESAEGRQEP